MQKSQAMIPFNKPFMSGQEIDFIQEAISLGKISGNGHFSSKCHAFFQNRYAVQKVLLTSSCTDALEMAAMLIDIKPGDEVIVPSYTFVSTALAFTRMGAKIVFVDSMENHPNMDANLLESLITPKTKAIVPVHYAGGACDMDAIMALANKHNIFVIEDAAQAIESKHNARQLGTIGHLGTFSFHETKNIQCGEGGLLLINDKTFERRAEILWEKGTDRASFFRGEINKYGWVDTGSSFLMSDLQAAFLYSQLLNLESIQAKRLQLWNWYSKSLKDHKTSIFRLPPMLDWATNNAHIFYLICDSIKTRRALITHLKDNAIHAVFHYQSLHKSEFMKDNPVVDMPNADRYTECLLRLPMFPELEEKQVNAICKVIRDFSA